MAKTIMAGFIVLVMGAPLIGAPAAGASPPPLREIRIGVMVLFHPRELIIRAAPGTAIVAHAGQETCTIENTSGPNLARIESVNEQVVLDCGPQVLAFRELTFTSRENGAVDFILNVPGKITRRYRGRLQVSLASGILVPVVVMDLETAVASVVAAESSPGTPIEALKSQAVAARSYFVAGKGRHEEFDFCDTTHCQYLRDPPARDSAASKATMQTRSMVLAYETHVFAPMYTRSCSGHTRTPEDVRLPAGVYPYYAVDCKYCHDHLRHWHTQIAAAEAVGLRPSDETARLLVVRRLGWDAVPSNDFTVKTKNRQLILEGVGQGHGVGLCQAGARGMAEQGASFREILAHYYPNATLTYVSHAVP